MSATKTASVNVTAAQDFYAEAKAGNWSTEGALSLLAEYVWPAPIHAPTVRRLAKPLCLGLDTERAERNARHERLITELTSAPKDARELDIEAHRAARDKSDAEKLTWDTLPRPVRLDIRNVAMAARGNLPNRRARKLAASHGLPDFATIGELRRFLHFVAA